MEFSQNVMKLGLLYFTAISIKQTSVGHVKPYNERSDPNSPSLYSFDKILLSGAEMLCLLLFSIQLKAAVHLEADLDCRGPQ